jgi:hypothetical protein
MDIVTFISLNLLITVKNQNLITGNAKKSHVAGQQSILALPTLAFASSANTALQYSKVYMTQNLFVNMKI